MLTLVMAVLTQMPVSTPGELGHLVVLESKQVESSGFFLSPKHVTASTTFTLSYENNTSSELRNVRIECALLDRRGIVNSETLSLDVVKAGETLTRKLRVTDATERGERAECRIISAATQQPES